MMKKYVKKMIRELTMLTTSGEKPNVNDLWFALKDIDIMRLNIKNFGYQLARQMQPSFASIDCSFEPSAHGLVSKPTTQSDVESPWFKYWCNEIKAAPIYHRKLWEFAFLLQVMYENDFLHDGVEGVGFGCGQEPLASYFASRGMNVVVTDLSPEKVAGLGWAETGQHTSALEQAFYGDIVSREKFDRHVQHRYVDMNDIPDFGKKFDFCWSVCALEHLGSIKKGLDFVENSLSVLKPGGIAIHTTEYNYLSKDKTIDNWPTVLFLKKHFEELRDSLLKKGHQMLGPDFYAGNGVLDKFIDVPPYAMGEGWLSKDQWSESNQAGHLKLSVDGFACTCYGIIVKKAS
jgi:SAM-dependent methyltransferase